MTLEVAPNIANSSGCCARPCQKRGQMVMFPSHPNLRRNVRRGYQLGARFCCCRRGRPPPDGRPPQLLVRRELNRPVRHKEQAGTKPLVEPQHPLLPQNLSDGICNPQAGDNVVNVGGWMVDGG